MHELLKMSRLIFSLIAYCQWITATQNEETMKQLYNQLKAMIEDLELDGQSAFNWVDLYNNQFEKKVDQAPLTRNAGRMPSVLIQFKTVEYQQLKQGIQRKVIKITFHVADELYADDGRSNAAFVLAFFERVEVLHQQLQEARIEQYTPLVRMDETQYIDDDQGEDNADTEYDKIYAHKITYETVLTDRTAYKSKQQVTLTDVAVNQS